jgi:dTDP-4-amino-4,6-dideoxygalactose transaminase
VIEDAAQALGATHDGKSVGLQGDAGFFSLAVGKGLSMFEGGVLVTRDADLRSLFRTVAATVAPPRLGWELRRSVELLGYAALYRPSGLRLAYGRPCGATWPAAIASRRPVTTSISRFPCTSPARGASRSR